MKVLFQIAGRYFLSKKKKSFINIISLLSMAGVAIGTMALVIVLSVFNGLEGLLRDMFGSFDPEIKIESALGKSFLREEEMLKKIKALEGVSVVTEVVEDKALLKYKDGQMYVNVKGVEENFPAQNNILQALVHGKFELERSGTPYAVMGQGIQANLSIALYEQFYPVQLWYPKIQKGISLNPENAFSIMNINPGGIFSVEKYYDESYVFVPISFARKLFKLNDKLSSIEVKCIHPDKVAGVQNKIKELTGSEFTVKNADEQHENLLRAVKLEKLFVFITFSFLLAVASINIFFSLYMLAIDKQKDISILKALGITKNQLRGIFIIEGGIIGVTGATIGISLGFLICYLQQHFGMVSMGMVTSIVDAYPVKMKASDFLLSGITILFITFVASFLPAARAARTDERRFLK